MKRNSTKNQAPPTLSSPAGYKLPLLISYAYLREENKETVARIMGNPDIELLVDSGAFSALNAGKEISLDEYMAFLHEWKDRLFGYIALDKLMDPKTTDANLKIMLAAGLSPIPVHVLGDDEKKMDELFEASPWVALGGFRRPQRGPAPYPYIKLKMKWAKGRKVHWLGFTTKHMLEAFKPFSCDCSSWTAGMMYGRVAIYHGRGHWETFTRPEMLQKKLQNQERIRRALDYYEVSLSDLMDARQWHNGNKDAGIPAGECVISKLPARSWARYVLEFGQEFGTRFFLATNSNKAHWLINAYELVTRKGLRNENQYLRDDNFRGLSPVAGRTGRSSVPALAAQAHLPRESRKGGHA